MDAFVGGVILIDVDQIGNPQIELLVLSNANEGYNFYHDKTNNVKKLCLAAQGPERRGAGHLSINGLCPVAHHDR